MVYRIPLLHQLHPWLKRGYFLIICVAWTVYLRIAASEEIPALFVAFEDRSMLCLSELLLAPTLIF